MEEKVHGEERIVLRKATQTLFRRREKGGLKKEAKLSATSGSQVHLKGEEGVCVKEPHQV